MIFLEWILLASSAPVAAACGYLVLLTLLSRRPPPPERVAPRLRFDIVVPAHDEEQGITATIDSLLALDYPRSLFRVVVVADNCTDDTAARARTAGALVLVRNEPALRGKGHALAHAFERVLTAGRADAVVVVDADTLVSPNLLRAFAARLSAGASAVQADYTVRNPDASWRTVLMKIAMGAFHTLRSLGREHLHLSAGLRGNGMCFTTSLLSAVPHQASSLVEDLEYGIRLGEAGYRVHYAHEARVHGEMPSGERGSSTQRTRWEQGRRRMAGLHAARLLDRAIRTPDPVCLDLALDLLVPPLGTLVTLTAAGLAASTVLSWSAGHLVSGTSIWIGCALGLLAYGVRGWQLSGTGAPGLYCLRFIPRYLAWKLTVLARGSRAGQSEWVRTEREGGR